MYFMLPALAASFAGLASATSLAGLGSSANVNAHVEVAAVAHANADLNAHADLNAARKKNSGYQCPKSMSYCPWTKACACPPGQKLDASSKTCVGNVQTGAWPEPDIKAYKTKDVELASFCAASPTKIVKYSPNHKYCQASLNNVAFCAPASIQHDLSVKLDVEVDIDAHANVSAELKNVCAALFGLYVETVVDAVVAFNTQTLGLATATAEVKGSVSVNIFKSIQGLQGFGCRFGWGNCNVDCVAYCTKGCKNYVDVGAEVGGSINGLVGFCVLDKVILTLNATQQIVAHVVDGMLCLVGGLIKSVLSKFDCHCH
ncbi:hypothetical protein E4U60_004396 [Claviceps pazoutovae]|uniref:Secreted protein n=1 Tax=Claviceps pazoutovae TaxID=1649127 RepID=A0A9P7MGZ7_9HYPO|nr:hypothetical protein E4U60_004396 [Claviceps pazoutovae]